MQQLRFSYMARRENNNSLGIKAKLISIYII